METGRLYETLRLHARFTNEEIKRIRADFVALIPQVEVRLHKLVDEGYLSVYRGGWDYEEDVLHDAVNMLQRKYRCKFTTIITALGGNDRAFNTVCANIKM